MDDAERAVAGIRVVARVGGLGEGELAAWIVDESGGIEAAVNAERETEALAHILLAHAWRGGEGVQLCAPGRCAVLGVGEAGAAT